MLGREPTVGGGTCPRCSNSRCRPLELSPVATRVCSATLQSKSQDIAQSVPQHFSPRAKASHSRRFTVECGAAQQSKSRRHLGQMLKHGTSNV
eukprot:983438-Rhodomonas_salina.1